MTRSTDQSRSHVHPLTRLMGASLVRRVLAGMALSAVSTRVGAAHIGAMSSLVALLPEEEIGGRRPHEHERVAAAVGHGTSCRRRSARDSSPVKRVKLENPAPLPALVLTAVS